ncbi:MAG: type I-E CRISPR-associated protein Cas6/Cse3/CasE [Rubrivivax sp.]|nr:type I-E CRISPR-associated protein Cas6/Cse3/CasE [Rubrivivax sp.]
MYFSLITAAPGYERDAAHDRLRGPYADHQWLWRFLSAPAGSPRKFLFRRHETGGMADGMPRWYVVSDAEPRAPSLHWTVQSKPYDPRLQVGDMLHFELRANPVVTTRGADGKPRRHDLVMHEKKRLLQQHGLQRWADWATPERPALPDLVRGACAAWLQARAPRLGVEVDAESLRAEGYEQHRGKSDALRFSSVDLCGRLRVADPGALRAALFEGVGHAKAFGCGLLLVRRLG